jgi:hypothetical protein
MLLCTYRCFTYLTCFPQVFPPKLCLHFPSAHPCYMHQTVSSSPISSLHWYVLYRLHHEAPHYATVSLLLLPPLWPPIYSSAMSNYVPPVMFQNARKIKLNWTTVRRVATTVTSQQFKLSYFSRWAYTHSNSHPSATVALCLYLLARFSKYRQMLSVNCFLFVQ